MISTKDWRLLAASIALSGLCWQAEAGQPFGLKLLGSNSLHGWEYGAAQPANWTIQEGGLSGNGQSTRLLSGWTFDDFELRFAWTVNPNGEIRVGFPDVPAGAGIEVSLHGLADGCGTVRDGSQIVAHGTKLDPVPDGAMHSASIRRGGSVLQVIVDGKVASEASVDPNRRFGLALSVPTGEATISELRLAEPRGNPLFNGKDLSGWWAPDKKGEWAAENGDLVCTVHRGLNYLRADKEYANFTFSFEYKISHGGNSGIGIRTAHDGWPSGDGMELQILDQPGEVKDSTMAIYGNLPPFDRADRSDVWNRVVVKADGRMISAWVNGELVQQVNTATLPELKHRHLKGWIGVQDHGGKIRFRELYVHEAPDGLGLDAWHQPASEPGPAIVLDRLMNSERLSRNDSLGSGVISKTVPKGGEHVLAELAGPGALVRSWRTFAAGQVAFYFDGEAEPRITCEAEHLFDHVPGVSGQEQPLLMCLPFAKSLKVVLRDPLPATYRLEYVTFPPGVPVQSFAAKKTAVPRGFLPAIEYRLEGLSGGKLREAEIHDRVKSEPRTIEPGTTVQLAVLEGAGLVNWLRLHAERAALANNDLWIEVTIDGESIPAIAAPARFLFPAFGTSEALMGYSSLVMVQHDGFANLLAMPFGKGLSVAARNRGQKPIEKVGVSMSIDRAADKNYAGRMRLRGVFQPAGSSSGELVHQPGSGRWVSLVYQQPDGATTGISSLVVDGQARDGWAMPDLDGFFGRPGEGSSFYRALSGRRGGLSWRYMLLEPVSFEHSLSLKSNAGDKLGDRLALFYLRQ
ncbi:MAG TPA: DUF1080 domain-containing protein [Pirellulales bacterium]|jgi:hypothetical protein|nr:DUF1080 domain-containing protein [Pirellulales bacterium]